jgi:hypothetical protein
MSEPAEANTVQIRRNTVPTLVMSCPLILRVEILLIMALAARGGEEFKRTK